MTTREHIYRESGSRDRDGRKWLGWVCWLAEKLGREVGEDIREGI